MKLKVNLLEISFFLVSWLIYGNRRNIHTLPWSPIFLYKQDQILLKFLMVRKTYTQAYQGWCTRKSLLMALSVNDLLNAPHCVLVFLLLDPCVYLVPPV
jgi:hypothetical protein